MNTSLFGMLGMAITVGVNSVATGAVLWTADFEKYTEGDSITTDNAAGDDNTFSSVLDPAGLNLDFTAVSGSGLNTGLAARLGAKDWAGSGSTNMQVRQTKLGALGDGSVLVVSFDRYKPADVAPVNLIVDLLDSSNVRILDSNINLGGNAGNDRVRVTLVMNQSGQPIALPGALGQLADNTAGAYIRKSDSTYASLVTKEIGDDKVAAGFAVQQGFASVDQYTYLDNFVVTDSITDNVGGTNILELSVGTPIPEPASASALGATGMLLLLRRW